MLHLLPLDRNLLNHRSLGISDGDPSCCVSLSPRIYLKTLLFPAKSESPLLMTTVWNDSYKSPQQLLQLSIIRLHVLCDLWAREEAPRFALARRDGSVCAPPPPTRFKRLKVCLSFRCASTEWGVQQSLFFLLSSALAPVRWRRGGVGTADQRSLEVVCTLQKGSPCDSREVAVVC